MIDRKRKYCHYCSGPVELKLEGDTLRDYCPACNTYFYENPLPVVSAILVCDRKVLLVKRANEPYQGQWCLPSGFAETGESIGEAALRELEEETGIEGRIIQLQDVDSVSDHYYGDLLFLTFVVEQVGGVLQAGDDAAQARYFSFDQLPELAFPANIKALRSYIDEKWDEWAIADSFTFTIKGEIMEQRRENLISSRLVRLIEVHSDEIARLWLEDVRSNRSTPTFHSFDPDRLYRRVFLAISHFGEWLSGSYRGQDIATYYMNLGRERKQEGFALSEMVSALSLTKKHIWEFALSRGMWRKTIDMYMILELERRISLFYDRATYYVTLGYEQ